MPRNGNIPKFGKSCDKIEIFSEKVPKIEPKQAVADKRGGRIKDFSIKMGRK